MIPFREAIYSYHLLGLDNFLKDSEKARQEILKVLEVIDGVNKLKPAAVYMNIFFDAKGLEIMQAFQPAPLEVRKKVHSFLVRLDPNKAPQYGKLIE
jgi:phosphoserine phosphatase